ncbi:MAG: GDSL-type esterase/lipase family protein [Parvibaculum sp.]|uniref:GDSL-type esterase/lipase family protein n=1 Tax=Parvibaculum sp. TaxID=2024848 RepID=UPI002848B24D|nr:GDSL-type esterase/lipase family protein [Parvibaculum sp.]MDR3498501.1 GDSL-type esterase/lipase family protein [Parvibaculum sp.]
MMRTLRLLPGLVLTALLLAGCATPQAVAEHGAAAAVAAERPFFVQPERMAAKRVIAATAPVYLVFIGDSITQNFEKQSAIAAENYKPVWDRFYGGRHALNLGYGMDTTGAARWRFSEGELDGLAPKLAVVLIGTNDTNLGRSAEATAAGVEAVVGDIRARLPKAKTLLIGILPSGRSAAKSKADREVNARLAMRYAQSDAVTYFDAGSVFLKGGKLDTSLYVAEAEGALHPDARGQAALAAAIEPFIAKALGDRARNGP